MSSSSSSECSSSSESESERETSPPPMTRTVERTFFLLRHKVKSVPKGKLEKELKESGRTRDVAFSPKLTKKQLGNLLVSCMPCLAGVPLDQLRVYKSTSRGSKVVKVSDSLPDAKELLSLMQGTKSKKILLLYNKSSKHKRHPSKAHSKETNQDGQDGQQDAPKEPVENPESSKSKKEKKRKKEKKHEEEQDVEAESSNSKKEKKRKKEKKHEEEQNVEDDLETPDSDVGSGAADAAAASTATTAAEEDKSCKPILQQHTPSVIDAKCYEGNGIIVGKLCKEEVESAAVLFEEIGICQDKLSHYDLLLSKGLQSLKTSPQDVTFDDEVVFGATASPNEISNESTLVMSTPDDKSPEKEENRDEERKRQENKLSEAALGRKKRRRARRRENEKKRKLERKET